MAAERMTRERFQETFGAMNPVGHTVLAFDDDKTAADARAALLDAGLGEADVLSFTSKELEPRLDAMMRKTTGTAGFGYEVTLMRRYMALTQENVGWLVVYAPDDDVAERVAEVARKFNAKSAVRYHLLASEDLL
ncbi:MAG: hypothetical protein ABIV63_01810 [Caldimonas sp.]